MHVSIKLVIEEIIITFEEIGIVSYLLSIFFLFTKKRII